MIICYQEISRLTPCIVEHKSISQHWCHCWPMLLHLGQNSNEHVKLNHSVAAISSSPQVPWQYILRLLIIASWPAADNQRIVYQTRFLHSTEWRLVDWSDSSISCCLQWSSTCIHLGFHISKVSPSLSFYPRLLLTSIPFKSTGVSLNIAFAAEYSRLVSVLLDHNKLFRGKYYVQVYYADGHMSHLYYILENSPTTQELWGSSLINRCIT